MKWFDGDIAAAISLAKSRNAIFVVYCEGDETSLIIYVNIDENFLLLSGKDEISQQMTNLINSESVSSRLESSSFVAIRIQSDKEEYMQFAKICE